MKALAVLGLAVGVASWLLAALVAVPPGMAAVPAMVTTAVEVAYDSSLDWFLGQIRIVKS